MVAVQKSAAEAVRIIKDGDTVALSGFGLAGQPFALIDALCEHDAGELTIVANNAGNGQNGLARLIGTGRVRKIMCSFPRQKDSYIFDEMYKSGKIELDLVPQGTLAERIRAQGAGIGGFFTPTAVGTQLGEGKEVREINGRQYLLELPIHIDVALIHAHIADDIGNLVYRKTARNFGPVMATAAVHTIAEVSQIVSVGTLDPEVIVTPSIFVNALVQVAS